MGEARVHISGFRMDFGDTTVIRDLSFDVRAGETFGFLGSNGSGQDDHASGPCSGIYQPTAGVLHIDGRPFTPRPATGSATSRRSAGCTRRSRSST